MITYRPLNRPKCQYRKFRQMSVPRRQYVRLFQVNRYPYMTDFGVFNVDSTESFDVTNFIEILRALLSDIPSYT